jgi:prophage antirepressor-like protein
MQAAKRLPHSAEDLINFQDNYVSFDFENKPEQKIKIVGTYDNLFFCGKDVCAILEYKDVKDALQNHVKPKYKKDLQTIIIVEVGNETLPTSIIEIPSSKLSYNEGKAVYINEPGLYAFFKHSKWLFLIACCSTN